MTEQLRNFLKLARGGHWRTILFKLQVHWKGLDLAPVEVEELGIPMGRAKMFVDSGASPVLTKVLKHLPISEQDAVLDFGSGKGGAMLVLLKEKFKRVEGVELSEDMIRIAEQNFRKMGLKQVAIYKADAASFPVGDHTTHFYFYNPFPREVMIRVVQNIFASLRRRPRKATVIYLNPTEADLFEEAGFARIEESFDTNPTAIVFERSAERLAA